MGVAVALQGPVLEVERLVAVARRLPGEHRGGEPPRLVRLPLEAALARIVVAGQSADPDVEVDSIERVGPQQRQRLVAVLRLALAPPGRGFRLRLRRGDEPHGGGWTRDGELYGLLTGRCVPVVALPHRIGRHAGVRPRQEPPPLGRLRGRHRRDDGRQRDRCDHREAARATRQDGRQIRRSGVHALATPGAVVPPDFPSTRSRPQL